MNEAKPKKAVTYRPQIFEVEDLESAKRIILTPEPGTTTEERWEDETPYLAAEIGKALGLDQASCVIDYGCGIGRVAKRLIERYGCAVVGVDISLSMRQLAPAYVASDRFTACAPEMLDRMVAQGFRATHACACWVIQHCALPEIDLARIDSALASDGLLFVLNNNHRCVPTDHGWANDGVSIETLLTEKFDKVAKSRLPEVITTAEIANGSFIMTLRKR